MPNHGLAPKAGETAEIEHGAHAPGLKREQASEKKRISADKKRDTEADAGDVTGAQQGGAERVMDGGSGYRRVACGSGAPGVRSRPPWADVRSAETHTHTQADTHHTHS